MDKDVVEGTKKMVCVRVNPNSKKLKGKFAAGSEMVRFIDALGREVDRANTTDLKGLRDKIEKVAKRFDGRAPAWRGDLEKTIGEAQKEKKLVVLLSWSAKLDEDRRWKKFPEAKPPGWYQEDCLFVKADAAGLEDYGSPNPGMLLFLDPLAKDFRKTPLHEKQGPVGTKDFYQALLRALAKKSRETGK